MLNNALFLIVFVLAILIIPWSDAYGDETQSVPVPASDSKSWDELTEDERSAAEDLGHSEANWNP